jgi:hypothetical protein
MFVGAFTMNLWKRCQCDDGMLAITVLLPLNIHPPMVIVAGIGGLIGGVLALAIRALLNYP